MISESIRQLRSQVSGRIIEPGDEGYDTARSVFNATIDRRPALIAQCATDEDVVRTLRFARAQNWIVSVKGTGHNVAGFAVCDAGVVIDLSPMKSVTVDPAARTARVGAGCTWGEVNDALQAHGLAAAGGFVSITGVSGLTLGGGLGWLVRKHGLALDNMISARVVLADGRVWRASGTENVDLFWALRGGGGNFGIVTEFEFDVHPAGTVFGGVVLHPAASAGDALKHWRDVTRTLPEEFTGGAFLLHFPQDPNAPEPLRGAPVLGLGGVYTGEVQDGERAVAPLRAFGPPIADLFQPAPYNQLQRMADFAFPTGKHSYWKSGYLTALTDQAIEVMVDYFGRVPSPHTAIVLEHNGDGALERVPDVDTSFGHRGWPFNFVVTSSWSDAADSARNVEWTRAFYAALRPFLADAAYVNYYGGDEGPEGLVAAYGTEKLRRLARLKMKYDPDNVFRMNHNVLPAAVV